MKKNKKYVIGITGASGSIYAKTLLNTLLNINNQISELAIVFTENAKEIWNQEIGSLETFDYPFKVYSHKNFNAPFASGSCDYDGLIICPCSMGILGRISSGISNDLITRAADVMLKEKRKLILVTREMPYNLIHIENMRTIVLSGGIICPASPSFYNNPKTIDALVKTVTDRVLDLAGFNITTYRWNR